MMSEIIVYTDGGARGNPGPSAIGVVIESHINGKVSRKNYKDYIGTGTNNAAEYKAMILALKELEKIDNAEVTPIEIRTDSELMHRQIIGKYKVKDQNLKVFFEEVMTLKQRFKNIKFTHIPRSLNSNADALVNAALDENSKTSS